MSLTHGKVSLTHESVSLTHEKVFLTHNFVDIKTINQQDTAPIFCVILYYSVVNPPPPLSTKLSGSVSYIKILFFQFLTKKMNEISLRTKRVNSLF